MDIEICKKCPDFISEHLWWMCKKIPWYAMHVEDWPGLKPKDMSEEEWQKNRQECFLRHWNGYPDCSVTLKKMDVPKEGGE